MFYAEKINNLTVYCSDLLSDLNHCFTTRLEVESFSPNIIAKAWNCDENNIIHPIQTHSTNVKFSEIGVNNYPDTDSVILTNPEQMLYLKFADCTPVILYNKKANVGAIAHAGWRGTVSEIVPKTVKKMIEYSHSDISDIYCVIGPAIGGCCYKVGEEVINGIKSSVRDYENLIISKPDGVYVDLKGVNFQQLLEFGVPKENIDICPFCTSCRNDLFYSYRKENGTTERHYAIIKLKN